MIEYRRGKRREEEGKGGGGGGGAGAGGRGEGEGSLTTWFRDIVETIAISLELVRAYTRQVISVGSDDG